MASLLKKLDKQERRLAKENEILAREALTCGYDPSLLKPPPAKRRKTTTTKKTTPKNDP